MPIDRIVVRGAREHNLKNIDVEIPRDKLVVLTGLSGSGKSSLAFDTIYAEGQRRYVESLSAYARQFLGQMEKPDVDQIDGLSPAISIDQKGSSRNPRSTVGTVTEIYDHLRLLFARIGHPHCSTCGREITRQSPQMMAEQVIGYEDGTRLLILGPVIRDRKGEHQGVFEQIRKSGFVRVRVDGELRELDEQFTLAKTKKHTIEVVVDRLVVRHESPEDIDALRVRLVDSLETALKLGGGYVAVQVVDGPEIMFSEHYACPLGHGSIGEIEPRSFSFNSPHGACPACHGLGIAMEFDPDLVVADSSLALERGAITPWSRPGREGNVWYEAMLAAVAERFEIPMDTPFRDLTDEQRAIILQGKGAPTVTVRYTSRNGRKRQYTVKYEGVVPFLKRRLEQTSSDYIREEIQKYMSSRPCPTCKGARLKPEILAITVADRSIVDVTTMSVVDALRFAEHLQDGNLSDRELLIGRQVLKEIRERLGFLVDVGLEYLTLDRAAMTLSGGEAQRIRLATQIGSRLMGVMYVLDEPSIGLHPRDNARLIHTLVSLRDIGNTLLVVEHDEETIRSADWVVDLGPGAGREGGHIVAQGTPEEVEAAPDS
ncbi:MAG: excinuclease ABC subunit UvrA, partial [Chloroflexota bacterium]|nr:excinuclease ABC subunit UvrA [Chloroflexota bacterium]